MYNEKIAYNDLEVDMEFTCQEIVECNNLFFRIVEDHIFLITPNEGSYRTIVARDTGNGHGVVISVNEFEAQDEYDKFISQDWLEYLVTIGCFDEVSLNIFKTERYIGIIEYHLKILNEMKNPLEIVTHATAIERVGNQLKRLYQPNYLIAYRLPTDTSSQYVVDSRELALKAIVKFNKIYGSLNHQLLTMNFEAFTNGSKDSFTIDCNGNCYISVEATHYMPEEMAKIVKDALDSMHGIGEEYEQ